jgi:hypothetical protein
MEGELPARRKGLPVKSGVRIATPSTSTTSLHLKIGRADLCFNQAVREELQSKVETDYAESPEVRMGRKKKAIVISSLILTVLAIPPLFFYVYLPFVFSGGLEGMRKRRIPAPDLKNPAIINRRASLKNDIEATFKVLDTGFV